ncbi:MAG: biotin/lipoyl-binding protein, partial [Candidatus Eisenbacteria bacterium]|nr:biotin/lipoyl-binding protein [Candidatus Eisenbacteria bacterium]
DQERILDVEGDRDRFRIAGDDGDRLLQWSNLGHGRHLIVVDGRSHFARIHRGGAGEYTIEVEGRQTAVRAFDEISARASRAQQEVRGAAGPAEVLAPMPGTVIQVLVSEGDSVDQGQALFTIEAMKMQNEIAAPIAGVVRGLRIEPGQAVEARFKVCRIEP